MIERGGYRFPPGLKLNLPFYLPYRFFQPGNPIALFEHLTETYGPTTHYRLGRAHIVFTTEPEFIREILVNQPQNFIKERTQRRMKILLGEGLITSDGEVHKRQRRIVAPAFHRQRVQAYGGMMAGSAAIMRMQWRPGKPIDIASQMMLLTLEIVARTLFNTGVNSDVLEINDQVNIIMELYNYLIALPRAEAYLHFPIPRLARFRRARNRLHTVIERMITKHRADGVDRGDLLSMMLSSRDEESDHSGMTDEQLRDEVLTIFLAGYETVANALTWTWYLLAQNPAAEARFHAEVDEVLGRGDARMEDVCRTSRICPVCATRRWSYPKRCAFIRPPGRWGAHPLRISNSDLTACRQAPPSCLASTSSSAARATSQTRCASIRTAFSPRTKPIARVLRIFPLAEAPGSALERLLPGWKECSSSRPSPRSGACGWFRDKPSM